MRRSQQIRWLPAAGATLAVALADTEDRGSDGYVVEDSDVPMTPDLELDHLDVGQVVKFETGEEDWDRVYISLRGDNRVGTDMIHGISERDYLIVGEWVWSGDYPDECTVIE